MEAVWTYEKARKALDDDTDYHRDIESHEINSYIYNEDTIKKVVQDLMASGLRVQSGELIGKTIIFAKKHNHAELIVKCFGELYPEYGADFCVLIDNQVNYTQTLIDAFEVRDKLPQIKHLQNLLFLFLLLLALDFVCILSFHILLFLLM